MENEITYQEMCDQEEQKSMQRGMNYRLNGNYSVILMSQQKNAPYKDKMDPKGELLEYEGHDE